MAEKRITDMTVGSSTKHIIKFALPLLFGNLFQQFYNLVDSIVVGNYVGANALAAVGACGSLNFLFFSLSGGISGGIGIIVAQYFGAGDTSKVKDTIANSIYVLGTVCVVVSIIGIVFAPQILEFLSTPQEIIQDSILYLRTTCAGMIAITAYNGVSSILRALGDSKTPLIFLIISCILNIGLDLILVLYFNAGVFGVALATIISQAISAVTSTVYACRNVSYFKITKEERKPDKDIIINSLKIGTPMAFQNSLIAISCIVLQSIVNSFGATVVAAFTVTSRVEQVVMQPYGSLSMAVTTFTGQNMGAGKIERVKKGLYSSTLMILLFSLLMLPVAYIFGESVIGIFVNEADVIEMGAKALRITSICYFPLGMIFIPRALLNGAGDAKFAMINGITEVLCRIVFSNLFTKIAFIGLWGIWITSGATWTVTAVVCILRYASGVWKTKAIVLTAH
ncbi:MAG: MATE family efflux transporter [Clostridium butyricum]|nr:MATE family efflux transporter [Clostridium butyricum]